MKMGKPLKKQIVRSRGIGALVLLTVILVSCGGYKVKKRNNPWKSYNISHVTVPLFINESLFPGVNTAITAQIIEELGHFTGLKISSGKSGKADALLLGIISGGSHFKDTLKVIDKKYLGDEYKDSLGSRRGFYIPRQQKYELAVQLVLIKNPTTMDYKILKSSWRKYVRPNSKIIFNETLNVSQTITRNIWNRGTVDDGGVVNFTQNDGIVRRSFNHIAKEVSRQFKELILYAF